MPKRVIDFDAMWASDKLASCAEWAQVEYAWLYGLADASGSFEITNLRVIWGRVAAIRPSFTMERLEAVFEEFIAKGLLFTWMASGKRYGHWTGCELPGRLPPPSWRMRLERLAPLVPRDEYAAYLARFSAKQRHAGCEPSLSQTFSDSVEATEREQDSAQARHSPTDKPLEAGSSDAPISRGKPSLEFPELKPPLEPPQAQEWDLYSEWEMDGTHNASKGVSRSHTAGESEGPSRKSPENLLEIYEQERGSLPPAMELTPQIRRQCRLRISSGLAPEDFRRAVRIAAATPFLAGGGDRGWCVTFDWLVANDVNIRKVLDGRYHAAAAPLPATAIASGKALAAADFGVRLSPAALERIRAREGIAQAPLRGSGECDGPSDRGISLSLPPAQPLKSPENQPGPERHTARQDWAGHSFAQKKGVA